MAKRDRRQLSIFFILGDLKDFAGFHNQSPLQTICALSTVTLHTVSLLITRDPTKENGIVSAFAILFSPFWGTGRREWLLSFPGPSYSEFLKGYKIFSLIKTHITMNIKSSLLLTFSWISSKNVRLSTYSTVLLGIASSLNCASWQNSISVSVLFLASLGKISLITYTQKYQ